MKRYEAYQKIMRPMDIKQNDIALAIHRSAAYVSRRFNGEGSFLQSECYAMMKLADLPFEDIYYYFPPEGIAVKRIERQAENESLILVSKERLKIVKEVFNQII